MKILTIAIPSYNVEQYIEHCLDSFLDEEVMDKLEILVVNDGSKDSTAEVAGRYEEKYPDIVRVITKPNGGHGSAINTGIANASGKYFKIVDADDWVDTNVLKAFVKTLEEIDVDIVASNFTKIDDSTMQPMEEQENLFGEVEYGKVYAFEEICGKAFIKMHAMTYRTQLLKEHDIHISEHCFYVDSEYIFFPIPFVKSVYFFEKPLYMYRLGVEGQSVDILKMQKNYLQHLHVLKRMLKYYDGLDKNLISAKKHQYLLDSMAKILASQIKIYISFPMESEMYKKVRDLDLSVKKRYPGVYGSVKNRSVWAMRKSGYALVPAAVMAYRLKMRLE